MKFKGIATNSAKCKDEILTGHFESKDDFIKWANYNNYSCDGLFVKRAKVFDYIWTQTPHTVSDFENIDSVPPSFKGYYKALKLYNRFARELTDFNRRLQEACSDQEKDIIISEIDGTLMALRWSKVYLQLDYIPDLGIFKIRPNSAKYKDYILK